MDTRDLVLLPEIYILIVKQRNEMWAPMNIEKQDKLQAFVENILEKKMSENEIKLEMESLGMIYTQDPLARLNILLQQLHPQIEIQENISEQ